MRPTNVPVPAILTALATFVVLLAIGAGSASATVLCTQEGSECPHPATFPAESEIKAAIKSGAAEMKTNLGTISCTESALTLVTSAEEGKPLPANATSLSFGGCTLGSTKCTVKPEGLSYSAPIEYTSGAKASLTLEEGTGEPHALVKCGFLVNCTFSSSALAMQLEGGTSSASIRATEAALSSSGTFCPEKALFTALYSVEQPPLFPGAANVPRTLMCQQDVPPRPCRNIYAVPQTFKAELEAEVKFPFIYNGVSKAPVCKISKLEGKTTTNGSPLVGELISLSFEECASGLCNIEALRLPYRVEFLDGTPDTMTWSSGGNGQPAFRITGCPGVMECTYGVSSIAFNVTGGNPAKFVKPTSISLSRENPLSEAVCSMTAKWEGVAGAGGEIKYKFTLPNPLFLVS